MKGIPTVEETKGEGVWRGHRGLEKSMSKAEGRRRAGHICWGP